MEYGADLPLMDLGGNPYTLEHLVAYTKVAAELGFQALAVNDHLVFAQPWLDGPTALAAVLEHSGQMMLATTVGLVVIRGPVGLAKTLGAIDRLSGGRLVAAVGPGSSPQDYALAGLQFEDRWRRFDEAVATLRALWQPESPPFVGTFYSTEGITLAPAPVRPGGPPIWIGSWGSDAGLRRAARLGDGWLASAYNTTPEVFGDAWSNLCGQLAKHGKDPGTFSNGLATMLFYITDDQREAERMLKERVVPTLARPEEMLRERLPIGSPEHFAEKLSAFARAGLQRVFIWPVADEQRQLELFWNKVRPLVVG